MEALLQGRVVLRMCVCSMNVGRACNPNLRRVNSHQVHMNLSDKSDKIGPWVYRLCVFVLIGSCCAVSRSRHHKVSLSAMLETNRCTMTPEPQTFLSTGKTCFPFSSPMLLLSMRLLVWGMGQSRIRRNYLPFMQNERSTVVVLTLQILLN